MTRDTHRTRRSKELQPISGALTPLVGAATIASSLAVPLDEAWWAERDAEIALERANAAAAERLARVNRRRGELADRGFPLRALEHALTADEDNPMVRRIAGWNPERENVLLISGSKGVGKTVAATWWALRWRVAPGFVRAATFAASSRYDRDRGRGDPASRDQWLRAGALVLDDMGAEFADAKGSLLVDLDELVDVFYGDRKPLVITTNCTNKEFSARYGERIVDRIRECGAFFEWSGPSLRRGKAAR